MLVGNLYDSFYEKMEKEKGIMGVKDVIMNDDSIIVMKIKDKLEIKLIQIKNTTDISYLFSDCSKF